LKSSTGGEKDKDLCTGDGGSPLVCEIEGKSGHYYQAGIVSGGVECGIKDVPGVYVDVAKYRGWIDQQIEALDLDTSSYTI
jgi:plasma kallikrein